MFKQLTPPLAKIIGNAGWLMVDRAVRMGLGVFVGVWVARYLGPSRFGSLSYAISFAALFGTLNTLGLDGIIVRDVLREPAATQEILGTAFVLRLTGSVLAPPLALLCAYLIDPNDRVILLLVGMLSGALVFQAFDTIDSYFQSQVQSKLTVWAKNSAFLVLAGVRIMLIRIHAPLWSFAAAQAAETALGAAGLIVVYQWKGGRLSAWRARAGRAGHLLKQGWPLMLSGMAIMIYMRIDMVMLKAMRGDHVVGIYAAATRISEVWYFIPLAIVSSVAPAIIRARDNPAVYHSRIEKLFSVMTLIAVAIGSGVALISHWIIHLLYADEYVGAAPVLAVHVWASVFVFLGVAQGPWSVSENLLKLSFYRTLAGAVTNVLLNLILIPQFSAMGAAVATVVSYAVSAVIANAFDTRTRLIFFMQLKSFTLNKLWEPPSSMR